MNSSRAGQKEENVRVRSRSWRLAGPSTLAFAVVTVCVLYMAQPDTLADAARSAVAAVSAVASTPAEEQAALKRGHSRSSGSTVVRLPDGVSDTLVVDPDRRRVAYVVRADGTEFVVLDRREGRRYTKVGSLTFSPDGHRLAYIARQG